MTNTVTYQDIEKANKEMIPTDIKGKEYADVPQRIIAFRKVYPTGSIETYQTRLEGEPGKREVEYTANIYVYVDGERVQLADGDASEKENSTFINKTSFIENCQTSAIGRALGFAGFLGTNSVASYEEVANAMNNQPKASYDPEADDGEPATSKQLEVLNKLTDKQKENIINHYGLDTLNEISKAQAKEVISRLTKK